MNKYKYNTQSARLLVCVTYSVLSENPLLYGDIDIKLIPAQHTYNYITEVFSHIMVLASPDDEIKNSNLFQIVYVVDTLEVHVLCY